MCVSMKVTLDSQNCRAEEKRTFAMVYDINVAPNIALDEDWTGSIVVQTEQY